MLVVSAFAALPLACGGGDGPVSPIECDTGGVTCSVDATCCPASDPFYCGAPADPNNPVGCYATLADAKAYCATAAGEDGGQGTLAYQCH